MKKKKKIIENNSSGRIISNHKKGITKIIYLFPIYLVNLLTYCSIKVSPVEVEVEDDKRYESNTEKQIKKSKKKTIEIRIIFFFLFQFVCQKSKTLKMACVLRNSPCF